MADERARSDERRRTTLGDSTSAAIPALWALLAEHEGSQAKLSHFLELDDGHIAKLLYGVRKAGRDLAVKLATFGVAIELWSQPLPEGWTLPHVAADQTGPQSRVTDADAVIRSTGS